MQAIAAILSAATYIHGMSDVADIRARLDSQAAAEKALVAGHLRKFCFEHGDKRIKLPGAAPDRRFDKIVIDDRCRLLEPRSLVARDFEVIL